MIRPIRESVQARERVLAIVAANPGVQYTRLIELASRGSATEGALKAVTVLTKSGAIVRVSRQAGYYLPGIYVAAPEPVQPEPDEAPKVELPKFSCPIAQFVYQQGAA